MLLSFEGILGKPTHQNPSLCHFTQQQNCHRGDSKVGDGWTYVPPVYVHGELPELSHKIQILLLSVGWERLLSHWPLLRAAGRPCRDREPAEGTTARGCCLPSLNRRTWMVSCWLTQIRKQEQWIPLRLLSLYWDHAGWGLECFRLFFASEKESCFSVSACILQQQMKVCCLRRMLPFSPVRVLQVLPWMGWWPPWFCSHAF